MKSEQKLVQGELGQKKRKKGDGIVGLPPSKKQDGDKKEKVPEDPNEWRDICEPVLEKIFSYLDWKDRGRGMEVCQRWNEVGGHPHLWSNFPLQLSPHKLVSFTNIHRLDWVKSVSVTLNGEFVNAAAIEDIVRRFPRLEELYLNIIGNMETEMLCAYDDLVESSKNKLVRIGTNNVGNNFHVGNNYFITSCDDDTNQFLKKTLAAKKAKATQVQVWSLSKTESPRIPETTFFTTQLLETICANSAERLCIKTSLMIGKPNLNIFLDLLKQHVVLFSIEVFGWFPDNAVVEPYNAILDLLGSKQPGVFRGLELHHSMLLKTDWVDRLGGAAKVKAGKNGLSCLFHHVKNGLKLHELRFPGLRMMNLWEYLYGDSDEDRDVDEED